MQAGSVLMIIPLGVYLTNQVCACMISGDLGSPFTEDMAWNS